MAGAESNKNKLRNGIYILLLIQVLMGVVYFSRGGDVGGVDFWLTYTILTVGVLYVVITNFYHDKTLSNITKQIEQEVGDFEEVMSVGLRESVYSRTGILIVKDKEGLEYEVKVDKGEVKKIEKI